MVLKSVVLPAPLEPTTVTNWPRATSSETPRSAARPPYATSSERMLSTIHPLLSKISFDNGRIPYHLGRRSFGDQLAVVEHAEPVRELHHGVHGVLDDDDGDA